MNYRHAYHAGNFADAMKHAALVAVLRHLGKKDSPFAVIDTHAGRGLYERDAVEAEKTGEAAEGIGRLLGVHGAPPAVAAYLDAVRAFDAGSYPGSPLLAARAMRPQDRLVAIEKHPEEFAALQAALAQFTRAHAVAGDGYEKLIALLPPAERRGVVLIDPPYEAEDEFAELSRTLAAAYRRSATGVYLIWLPLKSPADADALAGDIKNAGVAKLLLLTLDVGRAPDAPEQRLSAAGLFVINPPFGFAAEMHEAMAFLAARLAQGPDARGTVEWLAGGE